MNNSHNTHHSTTVRTVTVKNTPQLAILYQSCRKSSYKFTASQQLILQDPTPLHYMLLSNMQLLTAPHPSHECHLPTGPKRTSRWMRTSYAASKFLPIWLLRRVLILVHSPDMFWPFAEDTYKEGEKCYCFPFYVTVNEAMNPTKGNYELSRKLCFKSSLAPSWTVVMPASKDSQVL